MRETMKNAIVAVVIIVAVLSAFVFITSHIHIYGIGFCGGLPEYTYNDTIWKQIKGHRLGAEKYTCDWVTYTFKI